MKSKKYSHLPKEVRSLFVVILIGALLYNVDQPRSQSTLAYSSNLQLLSTLLKLGYKIYNF